jgi:hypothetical protein
MKFFVGGVRRSENFYVARATPLTLIASQQITTLVV